MAAHLLLAHHEGETLVFGRSTEPGLSTFGGPLELPVTGLGLPRPLHQIAWLNHNDLKCLAPPRYIWDLPLLHPMRYSGGSLRYEFSRQSIAIQHIEPKEASDSWPYVGFPELLPYYSLEVQSVVQEDWESFSRHAPNLPAEQPSELVILVPPPEGLGFTLWGRSGDAEGVTIVFECSLAAKQVNTYNVCG